MSSRKHMTEEQHIRAAELVRRMYQDSMDLDILLGNNNPKNGYCPRAAQSIHGKLITLKSELENLARRDGVLPEEGFPHYGSGQALEDWKADYQKRRLTA